MGALSTAVTRIAGLNAAMGTINNTVSSFREMGQSESEQLSANLRAQQDLAIKQLQQTQKLEMQATQERAALEQQKLAADAQSAEQQRLAALRRAMARQRASFGAQGVGAASGSSQAVLLGLYDESDADRVTRERLDTIRSNAIAQDIGAQSRLNVLQRSQLAEKQKLERMIEGF